MGNINKRLLIAFLITALLFTFSQAYAYTEITDCTQITSPGEYRLTQDIIDFPGVVCINIKSNDVILDCQGHLIDSSLSSYPNYGIYIDGYEDNTVYSNVTIKNCVLGEWYVSGIYLYYTSNVKILNSSFTYRGYDAIHIYRSNGCYLDNITSYNLLYISDSTHDCYLNNIYLIGVGTNANINIEDSSYISINNLRGINVTEQYISNSNHINITNSYIKTFGDGFDLYQVKNSSFSNIEIYGVGYGVDYASGFGFYISESSYNNFTNIVISNFRYNGIYSEISSSNNIFTNISISNIVGGEGVYIWRESNENYFKGLTIRNTSNAGIFVDYYPANNVFEDFTISDITGSGIWFTQVQDTNEFRNGRIERTGYAIRLEDAANQVFHGIIIKDSDNCGVYLWSSGYVPTQNNLFYNNIFMNRNNTCFEGIIYPNYWNTTLRRGKNILGGPFIGGNFWGRPDGKSILDELKYAIIDGIYGHPYDLLGDGTNVDYHPLAMYFHPFPPVGLGATARAIAQINPFAVLIFVLIPVIIGEFLIRNFEEIKVNEPLKAAIRLLILIISLALFAAAF